MEPRSSSTNSDVSPWLLVCCGLAVPVVYALEQQFYEAVALTFRGGGLLIVQFFPATMGLTTGLVSGGCTDLGGCLGKLVLILVVVFPLTLILIAIGLCVLAVVVALLIPYAIAYWLATNPGLPRYLLDLFLVWYVGAFLYGVLFPILWRFTEPVIAHTLGELAFQRARARVLGEQPRYAQPLYLVIALMGLIGGIGRVVAPASGAAAAAAATGWHQVSDPVFRPQWPKGFTVTAGADVATNIHLRSNEEVILYSDGPVGVSVEPGGTHYQIPPSTWTAPWGFDGRPGDLHFWGGPRPVTVWISGPPENHGHVWMHALATPTPQRAAARRHARRTTRHQ